MSEATERLRGIDPRLAGPFRDAVADALDAQAARIAAIEDRFRAPDIFSQLQRDIDAPKIPPAAPAREALVEKLTVGMATMFQTGHATWRDIARAALAVAEEELLADPTDEEAEELLVAVDGVDHCGNRLNLAQEALSAFLSSRRAAGGR